VVGVRAGGWLHVTQSVPAPPDGSDAGAALRDLARPRLLDNRLSYRLLDVEWAASGGRLGFGYTSYFETFDVCEAAAHEFADAWLRAGRKHPILRGISRHPEHDGNSVDPSRRHQGRAADIRHPVHLRCAGASAARAAVRDCWCLYRAGLAAPAHPAGRVRYSRRQAA
jgi:hypothetical protein